MTELSRGARAARAAWITWWNTMRRYHRYEVVGAEHLSAARPALVVGYHGRPIAHDLCMLQMWEWERSGDIPRAFIHGAFEHNPVLRAVIDGVGFLTGDEGQLREALARGDLLMVTPGGTREGCRSFRHRYEVDWGNRRGYLKLAMRHGLPIIPAAASGVDDMFIGLNDGDVWSRRLRVPLRMPAWVGVGPLGLWPLSPPFPVKVTQHIGAPITSHLDPALRADDPAALDALHREVTSAVQRLLDTARGRPLDSSPRSAR